jgi:uncharacterized membrane protein YhhN
MKTFRTLVAISVAASLTFLLLRFFIASDWPVIVELLSIFLLAVLGFRLDSLLGTALMLSLIGDFLLGVRRLGSLDVQSLFLLGLGSFLIAHLVYIAMFRKYWPSIWWKPRLSRICGVFGILVLLGSVLGLLWPSLGPMLLPVVLYSAALSCMGISAMLADFGTPFAAFGALSFIVSDAMIAMNKFRGHVPGSNQIIWITYYSAQLFILLGVGLSNRRVQNATGKSPEDAA